MNNRTALQALSRQAQLQSQRFSPQAFETHIRSMLVTLGLL
jgi:hypothetical protein